MKFLVLGCNGMAGHIITIYLKEQGHEIIGYARSKSTFVPTIIGDASNFELLRGVIAAGKYDVVINAIGLLNQFAEKIMELQHCLMDISLIFSQKLRTKRQLRLFI